MSSFKLPIFQSRMARTVAVWVFGSVVAIELVILVPSYQRRRDELMAEQISQLESTFVAAAKTEYDSPERLLDKLIPLQTNQPQVVGVSLYSAEGKPIAAQGESLQFQPQQLTGTFRSTAQGLDRQEVAWLIPPSDGAVILALRLNMQSIQAELNAYVIRILGLVVIISLVVTLTTLYTVECTIIRPLLKLRQDLLSVGEALQTEQPVWQFAAVADRPDEIGELFQAFQAMVQRVQQEMRGRHQVEADLRVESQLTQEAQDHADQLQKLVRELRGTQAQLIHSEKMASLGQLVAGIAHEFNNPVSFIQGNLTHVQTYATQLLELIQCYEAECPQPSAQLLDRAAAIELDYIQADLPKLITSMTTGTQRISSIVNSLRSFSRLDEAAMKAVDIHDGIESSLMLLQYRLNQVCPVIRVEKDYADLPLVTCFANQLNQVFIGLINNAIDAMNSVDRPGVIQITTRLIDDDQIEISIRDNGCGIATADQPRVFDPFFTTKPIGQGTGLGLSIGYQILQMHEGSLNCTSELGMGTTLTLTLPIQPAAIAAIA
jgi:signal transduction histidine kinase